MIPSNSSAVLAYALLDHEVRIDEQCENSDTSTDLFAITNTGRVADIIALAIENSGASKFYVIDFKPRVNTALISLLERWIDEYGDDEDSDLDLQLAELRRNRLAFRE